MKKLLLPLILIIFGGAAGVGAGLFLGGPAPEDTTQAEHDDHHEAEEAHAEATDHGDDDHVVSSEEAGYVKIPNQFIVPIIHQGRMTGMVIMSLAVEADDSIRGEIIRKEPKLRDAFLRVMFDHANIGGFDGNFIDHGPMSLLQEALRARAQALLGNMAHDVLILEIGRQELD